MDGVHDLAGRQGFGKVPHTANGPIGDVFKADWEHMGYSMLFLGVVQAGSRWTRSATSPSGSSRGTT